MNKATLSEVGRGVAEIPVHITYDIIRLFSEGLYRSPHKAIEELVSNSYDAGARRVHVLLPEQPEFEGSDGEECDPLWVIDDGHGMDEHGFRQLWRVADSKKSSFVATSGRRAPIGQFGIGKLAAYVIAWNLTHLSRVNGRFLLTEMDFSKVTEIRQHDSNQPFQVSLREVDRETASKILSDVETCDSDAWNLMFGKESRESTWTAVRLSNFRELYRQLHLSKLRWVLSAGFPPHDDFFICLNGQKIVSNKEEIQSIKTIIVGSEDDTCAREIGFERNTNGHIDIPGIGRISGKARIFIKPLTSRGPGSIGRGNGLYVGKSAAESDLRPGSGSPSRSCDLPLRVCGEVPRRGLAKPRRGRRVGPFAQAGLRPAKKLGRPAATRPARPEWMRGHSGPNSVQA